MVRADNMLTYASMKKAEERILDLLKRYGKKPYWPPVMRSSADGGIREKVISHWPAGTY
jgi:hypothetical protein